MLQNNENFAEAVEHLHTAVASGKVRPWVRLMQLGGLSSCDHAGARAELVRAANAMRKGGESLSPDEKHRVFDICCNVTVTEPGELAESLAAVPLRMRGKPGCGWRMPGVKLRRIRCRV